MSTLSNRLLSKVPGDARAASQEASGNAQSSHAMARGRADPDAFLSDRVA
jgi:hypothetical protein